MATTCVDRDRLERISASAAALCREVEAALGCRPTGPRPAWIDAAAAFLAGKGYLDRCAVATVIERHWRDR